MFVFICNKYLGGLDIVKEKYLDCIYDKFENSFLYIYGVIYSMKSTGDIFLVKELRYKDGSVHSSEFISDIESIKK